jgi:ribonucleoside-diphosphate reductase alpha chain
MKGLLNKDKEKLKIWGEVIKKRFESGYPYLHFTGNANKNAPKVYRDKGIKIYASNLCNEIQLSSDSETSFVCVLSSINLLHYDEWKDTDAVEVLTYFLDTVTEEYIKKTEGMPFMAAPNKFAREQRAVGLGVLGWHSYLQAKRISWESMEAKLLNAQIFKLIDVKSLKASKELAAKYGEPELLKGYGERMVTRLAIAPTTSSSFILGQVSQGIEPQNSNYYVKKLAKGSFTYKNPYLKELLEEKGQDTQEVWKSILEKGGSVQHFDFLSQDEKDVFKTFGEISPKEVVIQAAQRQKFIDQGQSLNLMIPPSATIGEVSKLLIFGWQQGIKGFYYQRSSNPSQLLARSLNECKSCEA